MARTSAGIDVEGGALARSDGETPRHPPTIADVAERASVSPTTVSHVLTGHRKVGTATLRRVQAAMKELNFRPHAGARSLRAGKTNVVALVVPFYDWASEPVLMPYIYGVVDAARQHGWNVMLVTGGTSGSEVADVLGSRMVDGVVLMEVRVDDERLTVIEQLGHPRRCPWHALRARESTFRRLRFRRSRPPVRPAPGRPRPQPHRPRWPRRRARSKKGSVTPTGCGGVSPGACTKPASPFTGYPWSPTWRGRSGRSIPSSRRNQRSARS